MSRSGSSQSSRGWLVGPRQRAEVAAADERVVGEVARRRPTRPPRRRGGAAPGCRRAGPRRRGGRPGGRSRPASARLDAGAPRAARRPRGPPPRRARRTRGRGGCASTARASSSRRRSPPESSPARTSRRLAEPDPRAAAPRVLGAAGRAMRRNASRFCAHREVPEDARPLRDVARRPPARACQSGQRVTSSPRERHRAPRPAAPRRRARGRASTCRRPTARGRRATSPAPRLEVDPPEDRLAARGATRTPRVAAIASRRGQLTAPWRPGSSPSPA